MATLLIAATEIHQHTDVEKNVWVSKMAPRIERAQAQYVVPLLGEPLYEELCAAHAAATSEAPLPAHLVALRTAVLPVLAQWVVWLSLPFFNTSIANRAIEMANDAVDEKQFGIFAAAIKREAEYRTESFKTWLTKHEADYAQLRKPLQPKTRRTPGGIVL